MNYVVKERISGKWKNVYFGTMADAKKYCLKIAKLGQAGMRLRNAL